MRTKTIQTNRIFNTNKTLGAFKAIVNKKSLAALSLCALSSLSAVEFKPFGFLGAYYSQGINKMLADNGNQAAYAGVATNLGADIGFSKNFSIGAGVWGAFPVYQNYVGNGGVGDNAYKKNWDVSQLYAKFDNKNLSIAGGRFDIARFYQGVDGKNYTGLDYLWGNIQGLALNFKASNFGVWALWMNSKLGVNGNYHRLGYELSSFNSFDGWKSSHKGEVFIGGVDFNFDKIKFSPFAMYDTNCTLCGYSVLSAGAKALIDANLGTLRSITSIRGLWQNYTIAGTTYNPLMLWLDEELIFAEIFKFGFGYIKNGSDSVRLYGHDRSRFYGYRGGATYGATSPIYYGGSTGIWYVFAGIKPDSRLELDLLISGGDYDEYSAVLSFRFFGDEKGLNGKVGGGFVGTRPKWSADDALMSSRNNAIAFVKLSF